jgi:hypothetical protein
MAAEAANEPMRQRNADKNILAPKWSSIGKIINSELENMNENRTKSLFLEAELQFYLISWKQRSSELKKFIDQVVIFKTTNLTQSTALLALIGELKKELTSLKVKI